MNFQVVQQFEDPVGVNCNFTHWSEGADRSGQTVQTQIRLLLEEQSNQGLHCLLFLLHLFDEIS